MAERILSLDEFNLSPTQAPAQAPAPKAQTFGVIEGTEKKKDPFTGEQNKAAGFSLRMMEANANMNSVMDSGFNPINFKDKILIEQGPFVPEFAENYLVSGKTQVFDNAALDFAMSVLRKESGAALTAEETALMFQLYIPEAGDKPEEIAQKRRARKLQVVSMKSMAGKAFDRAEKDLAESDDGGAPQIEALEILKKRAQTNPELANKLRERGLIE
ncbi:MAG TPA: hypothetical protein DCL66_03735 [Gammaproteobacteria bacterium]|nr:hypothetical protein [Gammaproteobacteria bacterium]